MEGTPLDFIGDSTQRQAVLGLGSNPNLSHPLTSDKNTYVAQTGENIVNSDLRAACERMQDAHAYYQNTPESKAELERDVWLLAKAYIAEHPSDSSLPITEEWLREMGFERIWHENDVPKEKWRLRKLVLWNYNGHCWVIDDMDWAEFTTRSQLRALLSALGIKTP